MPRSPNRFFRYLIAALPLLAAVVLYGYVVQLPLFLDDGPQFNMVEHYQGTKHWDGSIAYHYYRPVVFSLWYLSKLVFGFHNPAFLHLLNLFLFGMSGVVLGTITRRIVPGRYNNVAGLVAGIGFVIFPFSFQAVTLIGAMFHLVLVLCTALVLLLALLWLDGRIGNAGLGLCWLLAFLGIFSHENGVLMIVVLVALLVIVYSFASLRTRRSLFLTVPITAITAVYGVLWLVVPRAENSGQVRDLAEINQSFATTIQSLAYPLAALARPFITGTAVPYTVYALVGGTLLVCVLILWRKSRQFQVVAGYGLFWYLAGMLPMILLLDQHEVSGSPRILIFASFGLSLFWGMVLAALWQGGRMLRLLGAVVMVWALVVSVRFLTLERSYFLAMSDYMWRLMDLVEAQPDATTDGRIVLVNAPDYLSPFDDDRTFLRGGESAGMMDYRVNYDQQIWVNTGILPPDVQAITYTQIMRVTSFSMLSHGDWMSLDQVVAAVREGQYLYVTQFEGDHFWPVYVGSPNLPGPDTPLVRFGEDAISLTQLDMTYAESRQTLTVRARWLVDTPVMAKPFTHVLCDDVLVGQLDADPWGETYPFQYWQPGEIQTEYREIRLSQPFNTDACYAYVGLYNANDGVRLAAVDAQTEQPLPNDLVEVPFRQE